MSDKEGVYKFRNPFHHDPLKEADKLRKKQEKESKKQIPNIIEINQQIGNNLITGSCNVGIRNGKIIPTNCDLQISALEQPVKESILKPVKEPAKELIPIKNEVCKLNEKELQEDQDEEESEDIEEEIKDC